MASPLPAPKSKARFRVIIPQSGRAGAKREPIVTHFSQAGPLSIRITKGSRKVGGSPIPFTWPAGVEMGLITLQAGSVNDLKLFNWAAEAAAAAAGLGSAHEDYHRDVTIEELDRSTNIFVIPFAGIGIPVPAGHRVVNRWRLMNAWPTEYVGAQFDNNSNKYLIQSLTLTYDALRIVHPEMVADAADTRFLVNRV